MSTDAIPHIKTNDLPMSTARDDSWRIMAEQPAAAIEEGYAITDRSPGASVLKNPSLVSSRGAVDVLSSPVPLVPVAFDPPEHTRYRQMLQPSSSPRAIKPLEAQLRQQARFRQQAIELIEPIVERGSCDFVAEIAREFLSEVFLALFGLPRGMRDQLLDCKDAVKGLAGAGAQMTDEKSRRPSSRTGTRSGEELR